MRELVRLGILLLALVLLGAAAPVRAQTRLSPREAVAIALRENPSLAAAIAGLRRAQWAVVGENAAFTIPTLQIDVAGQHSESPAFQGDRLTSAGIDLLSVGGRLSQRLRLGTDLALRVEHTERWEDRRRNVSLFATGPVYDTSARLELTQPFWRGSGREVVQAALLQARAAATEAEAAAERTASQIIRDVLVAWWQLWLAEETLRIEEEALDLARRQRDEAQRKVELGAAAPVSVLTFETRVAEREESVASALRQRRERALALAAQLGTVEREVAAGEPSWAPVEIPDPETARRLAVERAPEVREAEAALAAANTRVEPTVDPFRPRLDLQGFAEVGGLSSIYAGFEGNPFAWVAGVNLIFETPLGTTRYRAAASQARLAVQEADRRLAQARLMAESGIDAERARLESAQERVGLARRTLEVAQAQLRAEQRKYEIGTATPIEVLQAEEAVRTARLRLATAEVELRSAEAAIEHLTGRLVERWAGELLAAQSAVAGPDPSR